MPTPASSTTGRRCSSTRSRAIPGIVDVATDQLNAGPMLDITIKREVASSYGILPYTIDNTLDDAFGQRIVSTMYTTLQPVSCRPGGRAEVPVRARSAQRHLCEIVERAAGAVVHAGRQRRQGGAARDQPSGPVPVGDDLVQPHAGHGDRPGGRARSSRLKKSSASRSRCRPASRATPRRSEHRCRARRS